MAAILEDGPLLSAHSRSWTSAAPTASQISNLYAWMFAFVPLIGSIVEATLSQNGVDVTFGIASIGYLAAYLVLGSLDTRMMAPR